MQSRSLTASVVVFTALASRVRSCSTISTAALMTWRFRIINPTSQLVIQRRCGASRVVRPSSGRRRQLQTVLGGGRISFCISINAIRKYHHHHLLVLNSTRYTYNIQYHVEQDTKAWSTCRCSKVSLIIKKTQKKEKQNHLIMV